MNIDNRYRGCFYACLAAFTYGLNCFFAMPLYQRGLRVPSVLAYRYGIGLLLIAALMLMQRKSMRIPLKALPFAIINAICLSLSSLFLYQAFEIMDVGVASTVLFVYPTMVAIGMMLFFHERPRQSTILAIVLSLAGVAVLNSSSSGGANVPAWGVILSLLSALVYAIYIIIVRQSPLRNVSPETQTFYCLLFGICTFLCQLKGGLELQALPDRTAILLALGMAFFPTVVSFVAISRAIALVGPTVTAVLSALEPVTAVFIGLFLFSDAFTWQLLAGIILILASVMIIVLAPARQHKKIS